MILKKIIQCKISYSSLYWKKIIFCIAKQDEMSITVIGHCTVHSWLSSIQASGILIQPAKISKKMYYFLKSYLKTNSQKLYVHPPRGISPSHH
jgi:hypothetical protein